MHGKEISNCDYKVMNKSLKNFERSKLTLDSKKKKNVYPELL